MVKDSPQRAHFEALYTEHRPRVLAYCLRRAAPADAEDACSETFLVAWRRLGDLPGALGTLPFLYGIASRVLSNQSRTLRRRSRLDEKLNNLGVALAEDPLAITVQSQQDQEVVAAVRKLKAKDREIVMLYAWEDLPRDVIAEMMGMTRPAIDQRIHRSYQRLARMLEPEAGAIHSPPIAKEGGA